MKLRFEQLPIWESLKMLQKITALIVSDEVCFHVHTRISWDIWSHCFYGNAASLSKSDYFNLQSQNLEKKVTE